MINAINNIQLSINTQVKFKLHSMTDKQTWRGKIIGICGYDVANQYEEVLAAHNNMEASVAKLEPTSMTFILIKSADGQTRPFATDWIIESTFERTDNVTDAKVTIHNVSDSELVKILSYIRDLGFEVTKM